MASRVSRYKVLDRCFSPITIFRDGEKLIVPCGKCAACRLSKANDWSSRLVHEIQDSRFAIYFTLTYSNKYLPFCVPIDSYSKASVFVSDHPLNIRFDGTKDVRRRDNISVYADKNNVPPITSFPHLNCLAYSSKRDVILYLKLLRKDLYETFKDSGRNFSIRYYIISEYGETKLRPHAHGIIFAEDEQVAEYLARTSLYKNWKMCDKSLFDEYVSFCDGGLSNYLTNYITSPSSLPSVYNESDLSAFRLASKNPPIGYRKFDKIKVSEKVVRGIAEYCVTRNNALAPSVYSYSSSLLNRLFPKAYRYSRRSYHGLYPVYAALFTCVIRCKRPYEVVSSRFRQYMHPSDWVATKAAFDFYLKTSLPPDTFLYLVDMSDYLLKMSNLRKWYAYAEKVGNLDFLMSYSNLVDYCRTSTCLEYLSLQYPDIDFVRLKYDEDYLLMLQKSTFTNFELYRSDVEDILVNSCKIAKTNELLGLSPSNQII